MTYRARHLLFFATALIGTVAGLSYWKRSLDSGRTRREQLDPNRWNVVHPSKQEPWDRVDEAGWESFPASDAPPSYTGR